MAERGGTQQPAWLFSFVDLAFLLLIAMTQVGSPTDAPDLGEIVVPRLESEATSDLPQQAAARWQLRVHPPGAGPPYALVPATAPPDGARLDAAGLRAELSALRRETRDKPLLAPHRDSRSQDLLEAVGIVEELWPGRRRATVLPEITGA